MAVVDWALLGVLAVSFALGAWRGLTYEVLSLVAWGVAFFAAQWGAPWAMAHLPVLGSASPAVRHAVAFVVVFLLVLVAGTLVAVLAKKLMQAVGLSPLDRLLGAVFGLARGMVILLVVAIVVLLTGLSRAEWWRESAVAPVLVATLQGLKPAMPERFASYLP